jgi:two-component system, OmpR family, phosphate regulon sensor histidine kinase PhoR
VNTEAGADDARSGTGGEASASGGVTTRAALWWREIRWVLLAGAVGTFGGWLFENALAGLALALLLLLLLQIRNLIWLRAWLQHPKRYELPESAGLWGEVFDSLLDLQRKNRKRKKKLTAMLAEFQASTSALPDGAVVLGERGEILWFNHAARRLLGLRLPQDVGIRVPNLIRHPAFTQYFDGGDFEREAEVPSPVNRVKTLSLRIVPYGRNQRLMIVRDVSERLQLDAAISFPTLRTNCARR